MFEPCRRPRPYEHGDEQASACVYLAERFSAAAVTSAGTELFIAQCNALFDRAVNETGVTDPRKVGSAF